MKQLLLLLILVIASGCASQGVRETDASEVSAMTVEDSPYPKDAVRNVIRSQLKEYRACYVGELKTNPAARGKVVMQWTINAQGKVQDGEISSTEKSISGKSFETCILGVLSKAQFPPAPGGAEVEAIYPFHFAN